MVSITIRPAASSDEVTAGYAFFDAYFELGIQHQRSAAFYQTVFA